MWIKKIKQKKIQFLLISIILMVSSSIFAISSSFTSIVNKYTKEYYDGENIKDIVVQTYSKDVVPKIENYIKEKDPSEKDIRRTRGLMADRLVFNRDINLDLGMTTLVTYEGINNHPWDVVKTEGENTERPSKGTVWVQNILADSKSLKVGDMLRIKDGNDYKELKISALVNDSMSPSSVIGYANLFINDDDYNEFKFLLKSNYIGYNSQKEYTDATSDLISFVGGSIDGVIYDKWITIFAANASSTITSAIGLSTAILIFIVSIIIIRFVLWNNILKEYKSIGVYKSLGFTSRQIRNIYLKSYGIVGIIAIIIGSFLSLFFTNYLVKISVKYIGKYKASINGLSFILITVVIMSLILILNIYLLLKRINKIKPVEAFRVGITSSKKKFKKSLIKGASSALSTSINDIFKYRKQNIIIAVVLTLVLYLSIFLISVNYSMIHLKSNAWNIFGVLQGDISMDFPTGDNSYNRALEDLKRDPMVKGKRECSYDVGKVVYIDTAKYNIKNAQIINFIYDNYDQTDDFKLSIKEGRNPKNQNEIAISEQMLKDAELDIGDYFEVKVLGEKRSLLITGKYIGMMSNNYSCRLTMDIVPSEIKNTLNNLNINITLNNKKDFNKFKEIYMKKYAVCSIDIAPSLIGTASVSVIEIVKPVTTIILTGVILFSLLNIINLIIMNNNDNRRNNGILKSLGFSSEYIIKRTVYRILILTSISSIVAFSLNILASSGLFKVSMMGIDGLMISNGQVIVTLLTIDLLTIIASIIATQSIKKISTVELMEE